ncbi:MAG: respiratory nitrate reductase subunit gamma [Gemmatimonadales bacterium]|nr:respiratory nitrate reductase subunit gamma [Gemmatimonadales bacterium]
MNALNVLLFVVFPYAAVIVFVVGVAYRYRREGFTVSSLSSQFLEGKRLFWGSVPFHLGILVVFVGHLTAFLLPEATLAWNSIPARLIVLEVTAFAFGLTVLAGLVSLMYRRLTNPRIRAVTSKTDIAIELLLLAQVVLGCWIALGFRWGSSWFAADLSPYLWSLVTLGPETDAVFALPWVIKLHIVGAFAIIFMVPFTRLVHFVVAPLHYIARPYQQVIWNWDRKTIRDPNAAWTRTRPTND